MLIIIFIIESCSSVLVLQAATLHRKDTREMIILTFLQIHFETLQTGNSMHANNTAHELSSLQTSKHDPYNLRPILPILSHSFHISRSNLLVYYMKNNHKLIVYTSFRPPRYHDRPQLAAAGTTADTVWFDDGSDACTCSVLCCGVCKMTREKLKLKFDNKGAEEQEGNTAKTFN